MAAMQHVCLDSSWGQCTTPSHLVFSSLFALFEESEPNRYSRGRRGGSGEQCARQQMEMDGEGWFRAPCLVPGSALESPSGGRKDRGQYIH